MQKDRAHRARPLPMVWRRGPRSHCIFPLAWVSRIDNPGCLGNSNLQRQTRWNLVARTSLLGYSNSRDMGHSNSALDRTWAFQAQAAIHRLVCVGVRHEYCLLDTLGVATRWVGRFEGRT